MSDVRWNASDIYPQSENERDHVEDGWTLQVFLALQFVTFCDQDWKSIGNQHDLTEHIMVATGIESGFLTRPRDQHVHSANVAQKMSWASLRTTTREEDMAYCLHGLFDVSIPLLYGEGKKAFCVYSLIFSGRVTTSRYSHGDSYLRYPTRWPLSWQRDQFFRWNLQDKVEYENAGYENADYRPLPFHVH
jgi:hypothetical protein